MTPDPIRTPGVAAVDVDRIQTPGVRPEDERSTSPCARAGSTSSSARRR